MTDTKPDQPNFYGGGYSSPTDESEKPRNAERPSESQALFEVVKVLEQLGDNELRAPLADEIWGEIDHKLNYPHAHPSVGCREQILAFGAGDIEL